MLFDDIVYKEPIIKGWSNDKKYCITVSNGTKYLLRITPYDKCATRKELFEILQEIEALEIPMCKAVEFGSCEDGIYIIYTWVYGVDAEVAILAYSKDEQYAFGVRSGEILKKIHTTPAPLTQEDWHARFNRKTDIKIQKYHACGIRFHGDTNVLVYLKNNRDLFKNRPQSFQHGDYHIGNMMIENKELVIIDFDRFDFGDPWEEFNRIVWCAQATPCFATGMVNGYFSGKPPIEFWKCLAFYIGSNTLSSIYWAIGFGQSDLDVMLKQSQDVLAWYDNFNTVIPIWYLNVI